MNNRNYRPWFVTALVLVVVGILVSVTFYMQLSTTINTLALTEGELSTTQTELTTTQNNLDTTQGQLSTTQNELSSTRSSLTTTQGQLATTQGQLATTQGQLTTTQGQLAATQNTLISTQSSLAAAQTQAATLQTSLAAATSQVAALQNQLATGHILVDPTYAAMQAFIASDKTDQNTYNVTTYNCVNFSADVIANAAKQNIRCAYINIDFGNNTGHAIVAFNTSDKGIVYIESQTDEIVLLKVGTHYWQSVIPRPGYYYPQPNYDDTVTRFVVVW